MVYSIVIDTVQHDRPKVCRVTVSTHHAKHHTNELNNQAHTLKTIHTLIIQIKYESSKGMGGGVVATHTFGNGYGVCIIA